MTAKRRQDHSSATNPAGGWAPGWHGFDSHGPDIVSRNANGNPVHPAGRRQGDALRDTIRIAGEMGIPTVCTLSGLPAGRQGDQMPNWVISSGRPRREVSSTTGGTGC